MAERLATESALRYTAMPMNDLHYPQTLLAIYGGSFNPPGLHHIAVARLLCQQFSHVVVLPCGFRNDKVRGAEDWISSSLRRELMELSFTPVQREVASHGCRLDLDFRDLDNERFTTTADLAESFASLGQPWFVVGADLLLNGRHGKAPIQVSWYKGRWIWDHLHWICLKRPGYPLNPADLPPHHCLIDCDISGSGSLIRQRIRRGESVADLVTPAVEALLLSNQAYR